MVVCAGRGTDGFWVGVDLSEINFKAHPSSDALRTSVKQMSTSELGSFVCPNHSCPVSLSETCASCCDVTSCLCPVHLLCDVQFVQVVLYVSNLHISLSAPQVRATATISVNSQ